MSHIEWHMTHFDTSASYIEIESENHNIQKIGLTFLKNEIWLAGVFSGRKIGVVSLEIGFFSEQWTPAYTAKALDQVIVWTWESQTKKFLSSKLSSLSESYWEFPMVKTVRNASNFHKDTFKIISLKYLSDNLRQKIIQLFHYLHQNI